MLYLVNIFIRELFELLYIFVLNKVKRDYAGIVLLRL